MISEDESDTLVSDDANSAEGEVKRKMSLKKEAAPASNGRVARQSVVVSDSDEEASDAKIDVDPEDASEQGESREIHTKQADPTSNASESDMSEVRDEPQGKRKRPKDGSARSKAKPPVKAKPAKATASKAQELDPDEAEIKRLQSWLLKCGIRKLWHKELAPYDSPKAKTKHLKEMLKDAGMDGRFSVEKASHIKEQRELAADLEAVKEGARKWGHGDESDEEQNGEDRPRRRAAAARFVDFGDDGEESD